MKTVSRPSILYSCITLVRILWEIAECHKVNSHIHDGQLTGEFGLKHTKCKRGQTACSVQLAAQVLYGEVFNLLDVVVLLAISLSRMTTSGLG